MTTLRCCCLLLALWLVSPAEAVDFPAPSTTDDAAFEHAMPLLAAQLIALYEEPDRDRYLNNRFRLELVAGRYADANASVRALRQLRAAANPDAATLFMQYEIYAIARERQAAGVPFGAAFKQVFLEAFSRLDDKTAYNTSFAFSTNLENMRADLARAREKQQGRERIELVDALDLTRKYQAYEAFRRFQPLTDTLLAADDAQRYVIDRDILVKTRDGASISVLLIRSRATQAPLPTLLNFTIYAKPDWTYESARRTAANGYAGVVALTRGKGKSPDGTVPYEHDGRDAADVIEWIARQPWSDGRVGMYGGSYEGYVQWSTAKQRPAALKAIMPSVALAPGIDIPMEGNVFMSFPYKWFPYVTNDKALDDAAYFDDARWNGLDRKWYATGAPYRSLEKLDGKPNPYFRRWLEHPGYDAYWQRLIPYQKEFAAIDIPVLSTTGYYDGCLLSTLYYFGEHAKYHPRADHTLVVGPFDHVGAQRRAANVLMGYEIDPVARIDIADLRYQWFDHVLKGGPRPALLKGKVNYQVMGANVWKHAVSLPAVANGTMRFHLGPLVGDGKYQLSTRKPVRNVAITQIVDFADRRDADRDVPPAQIVSRELDVQNGLAFVSDAFATPAELSGLFSGRLDFIVNKKDFDVNLALYELTPGGDYFQLSYYQVRASYAADRSRRQLLKPGQRQQLTFTAGRMTSRQLQAGSRLVVVLSIPKQRDMQINYGTGKDVSDESIADAKSPLAVKWLSSSYIDVPFWR